MATIAATHTVVKSKSSNHPFGFGILRSEYVYREPFTQADIDWAATAFLDQLGASATPEFSGSEGSFGSREISDAEWDRLASERESEDRYEAGLAANDRCILCGLESPGGLTNSLCDRCGSVLDRDGDIEGGTCAACGRACDYLEPSGMCCPCDLQQADASFSGNRGF